MNNNNMTFDLIKIVNQLRSKNHLDFTMLLWLKSYDTLLDKCIIARQYLKPQSSTFEKMIKDDLNLGPKIKMSGDGRKNNINYEIKTSLHDMKSRFNFRQIRPQHDIDQYILIGYNLHSPSPKGPAYLFKIPSKDLYELILKYGSYTHGTIEENGKITEANMFKGRHLYSLNVNPNAKRGKSRSLFLQLMKYETAYDKNLF
jgi:hypothetical protein